MKVTRPLTDRQRQIIELASEGKTDKEISTITGLAGGTLRTYWDRLRHRYEASSRTELIAKVLGTKPEDLNFKLLLRLPLFVWTADPSGQIDFCNEWFQTHGGLSEEDAKKGCQPLMSPTEFARIEQGWKKAQASKVPYEALVHLRCGPNQEWVEHKIRLIPLFNESNQLRKWIGYARELAENADAQMAKFLKAMIV
jgi:DNA-binding CsgD family transcriptional regulator